MYAVYNLYTVYNTPYITYTPYIIHIFTWRLKMNQMELKEILSNFSANSGAQLKYYIITSLFPEADKAEIKTIGDFNSQSFSRIEKAVRELELNPLMAIEVAPVEASCSEDIQEEDSHWTSKYDELAEAATQREMDLLKEISNLKTLNEKATCDLQGALMKIQYLERELESAQDKIEKLEKVKF